MLNCPACASERVATAYVMTCQTCGHRWLGRSEQDQQNVEAATFRDDYSGYKPDPHYIEAVTAIMQSELASRVPAPAKLLDIGCGAGDLMTVAASLGYDPEGIDISQSSAEICRRRGLKARAANFLACDFDTKFDLITFWDVIAHLRDPAAFLTRARSLLTNRGYLFIKTPSFGDLSVSLSNSWPRLAGLLLGAPSHSQYFDRQSLSALLERTGFKPEWIEAGDARSGQSGGSIKRRLGRSVRAAVKRASGDSNLYVAATPV